MEEGRLTEVDDNPVGSVAGVISAERQNLDCTEGRRPAVGRRIAGVTAGERGVGMVEGMEWETVCTAEQGTGISANGGCKPSGQRPVRNCYQTYKQKRGVTNENERVLTVESKRLIVCCFHLGRWFKIAFLKRNKPASLNSVAHPRGNDAGWSAGCCLNRITVLQCIPVLSPNCPL